MLCFSIIFFEPFLLLSHHHHKQQPPLTVSELYTLSMPRLRVAAVFSTGSKAVQASPGMARQEHSQPPGRTTSSIRLTARRKCLGEGLSGLQGHPAQGVD